MQGALGRWQLRFRNAATGLWEHPTVFPTTAATLPGASWQPEGKSQFREADGYRAVRISETQSLVQLLGATFGSAQYPDGYYPTCSDLIEVTAQVATSATGQTGIDQLADENLCGPMTVNFYLDPKPAVEIPSFTITAANQKYAATVNVRVITAPMMGNITGATYRWQREVWRSIGTSKPSKYVAPAPGSSDSWSDITFANVVKPNGNIQSGGTYSEGNFDISDSVRIRCVMDLTNVPATNTLLDRTCTTMISEPIYVVMPPDPPKLLSATAAKTGEIASSAQQANDIQSSTSKKQSALSKPYTIDLFTAPNPAETQIGLHFTLPDDAQTTVEIIDALQRIALIPLSNEWLSIGEHAIALSVGMLPSGAYSVRITAHLANSTTIVERRVLIVAR